MTASVCFIDTETLGLDPDLNPVWEVGLILPDGTEREWQIRPTEFQLAAAHPKALEISGYHQRFGSREPDVWPHVCRDLHDLIEPGTHLAGAVVSFDEERLRRRMLAHGFEPRWHYHLIEVENLAVGYLRATRPDLDLAPPWDSSVLSQCVGVEPDQFEKHTALGDARWAKAIYDAVMSPAPATA